MMKWLILCCCLMLTSCVNTQSTTPATTAGETSAVATPQNSAPQPTPSESATAELSSAAPSDLVSLPQVDVWQRIASQIQTKVPNTAEVAQQREFYRRNQRLLNDVAKRAEPFLYEIVEELARRQMPLELALLPIVESSFNPLAQAGAPAGLWQMVPQTARNFGLKRNEWYDGRKDPLASTRAALDYLNYLYQHLGNDWLNAVAGFNSGEGRVQQAIARNLARGKAIDFWSLNLPKQSTVYLPKWLALIDLLQHQQKYGVSWQPIANHPVIQSVKLTGPLELAQVAQTAGLSLAELKKLNPAYRRSTTASGVQQLVLPLPLIAQFNQNKHQLKRSKLAGSSEYQVKTGDSLGLIAKKHGTSVARIRQLNRLSGDKLKIGQVLLVSSTTEFNDTNQAAAPRKDAPPRRYTVQAGDNVWSISKKLQVNRNDLLAVNQLSAQAELKPGQKLTIPAATKTKKRQVHGYVVKKGDSLDKISRQHKIKLQDLLQWNGLRSDSMLKPGQKLRLAAP